MTTKILLAALFLMLSVASGIAQDTPKKVKRAKERIEKQHMIDSLVNSKVFVFTATRALPMGGNSIDLTTNSNSLKFHPEKMESYMPFFGRAYSIDYGGDGGIKFEGKPTEYKVVALKEGRGFEIKATVPVTRDNYQIQLRVNLDGSAILTINSNQRSAITYHGNIVKFVAPEEK